jgi:nitroreductase
MLSPMEPELTAHPPSLAALPLSTGSIGLMEGLSTTRSIRRYCDEPVPPEVLRDILFAATRAPSGSNRQLFRFVVLTDGPIAEQAKELIARGARTIWEGKRAHDGYASGSGTVADSPKSRMANTMQGYVDNFASVPVLILPCLIRHRPPTPTEGASIYPACQNLLLAARGLGYGGVITGFDQPVSVELRELLHIPNDVFIAATITIGKPVGSHGPVRRRPLGELVYGDSWGTSVDWAIDPPGTAFTSAGPPKPVIGDQTTAVQQVP